MVLSTPERMVKQRSMLGKMVVDVLEAEVEPPLPLVVLYRWAWSCS